MSALTIPVEIDASDSLRAAIAELRGLCERAEAVAARIEAFEQRTGSAPQLVVRADCDVAKLLEMLAIVRAGAVSAIQIAPEQPITDGGTL